MPADAASRVVWEAAVDRGGLIIEHPTYSKAVHFRQRLNQYRVEDRKDSEAIYPSDHPLYGKSEFDRFTTAIEPHPETNPGRDRDKPWIIRIIRDSELLAGLKILDPDTFKPLNLKDDEG